jgi:hypothetical protein
MLQYWFKWLILKNFSVDINLSNLESIYLDFFSSKIDYKFNSLELEINSSSILSKDFSNFDIYLVPYQISEV